MTTAEFHRDQQATNLSRVTRAAEDRAEKERGVVALERIADGLTELCAHLQRQNMVTMALAEMLDRRTRQQGDEGWSPERESSEDYVRRMRDDWSRP